MADYTFTEEEKSLIKRSLSSGPGSWSEEYLTALKARLKEYLKIRQRMVCCYCLRSFHGEFNFVIDIEHVLPKYLCSGFMFEPDNLAASSKRCNMNIKGNRVDFIVRDLSQEQDPFASEHYRIIHPNRDVFKEHIKYLSRQSGRDRVVFYTVINNSTKGQYSFEFFRLKSLIINSFDEAQGIEAAGHNDTGSPARTMIARKLTELEIRTGQI